MKSWQRVNELSQKNVKSVRFSRNHWRQRKVCKRELRLSWLDGRSKRRIEEEKLFTLFLVFSLKSFKRKHWFMGVKTDEDWEIIDGFHSVCVSVIGCLAERIHGFHARVFDFLCFGTSQGRFQSTHDYIFLVNLTCFWCVRVSRKICAVNLLSSPMAFRLQLLKGMSQEIPFASLVSDLIAFPLLFTRKTPWECLQTERNFPHWWFPLRFPLNKTGKLLYLISKT